MRPRASREASSHMLIAEIAIPPWRRARRIADAAGRESAFELSSAQNRTWVSSKIKTQTPTPPPDRPRDHRPPRRFRFWARTIVGSALRYDLKDNTISTLARRTAATGCFAKDAARIYYYARRGIHTVKAARKAAQNLLRPGGARSFRRRQLENRAQVSPIGRLRTAIECRAVKDAARAHGYATSGIRAVGAAREGIQRRKIPGDARSQLKDITVAGSSTKGLGAVKVARRIHG